MIHEMSSDSSIGRTSENAPPPPNVCDECGSNDFTPCSKPPSEDTDSEEDYVFAYHECAECGEKYNETSSDLLEPDAARIPSWQEIFGHPSPYEHQRDGILHCLETSRKGGYTVMEGGCGTGKTMIALTAGLTLVKDPRTRFERVMVLTSVKQQLRQFESDLKIINENLPDDIPAAKGVTLVGKTDLCPYAREEKAGVNKENVNRKCRTLRDKTSKLMADGMDGEALARNAVGQTSGSQWSCAGADAPYGDQLPESGLQYCPFYANYKEHKDPLFTFGHAPDCILHPDQIVKQAVQKGVCPHSAMSVLCRDADVVIANYYHAFDRNTLQITHALIDETTLLVCDEAHMLEPRVRGILSTSVPSYGIGKAASEVGAVYNSITSDQIDDSRINVRQPPRGLAVEKMSESQIEQGLLKSVYFTLRDIEDRINESIQKFLDEEYSSWRRNPDELDGIIEIPFRDPTKTEVDSLTKWAENENIPESFWDVLPIVASLVEDILSEGSEEGETTQSIGDVAQLFEEWFARDHTKYFREITLTKKDDPHPSAEGWGRIFDASVEIHSVMPRATIGGKVGQFGAGILMSATLEPIDVYTEVTGLDFLSSMRDELVTERTYSADFPKENRLSITLNLPKFTYENRGDITESTETRRQYAQAITTLARTTPGNVLVCMPSYREGKWAAALLNQSDNVEKEVLLDQSSGEKATQRLKQRFIDGDPKVLVTSLRGTLTEGVDFDGDKLLSCIVCGVPIENVGSPKTKALRTAYEDQFGGIGFDYGLTVPAVRKTRQALGRVIRNTEDVGVRVLVDRRYAGQGRNSVRQYLSDQEQEEYGVVDDIEEYRDKLVNFWESQN